ncbi:MAG TPA: branched-chain amino acid ABC transporter permease [Acidimicrobiales bacterium]
MDWGSIIDNSVTAMFGLEAVVFALAAVGLNMHFGYTGLLNFGQVGFMAVGAYGAAVTVNYYDLSLWAGVVASLVLALVLALLLGLPTLRLRADYLAIVTIAAGEIIRLIARSVEFEEITGGSSGLSRFAQAFYDLNPYGNGTYGLWFVKFDERRAWVLTVGWLLVILLSVLVFLLIRSPWGRVLKAIREDEDAARSLGKNVYSYKMQSLVLGGIIGAFGGLLLAIGTQSVQPDSYSTPVTFFAYTALILGGTARIGGPILGSMLFWGLLALTDNLLRQAISADYIPTWLMDSTQVGQVRFMLVGVGLAVLMVFRPQGIFGDRREIALDAR